MPYGLFGKKGRRSPLEHVEAMAVAVKELEEDVGQEGKNMERLTQEASNQINYVRLVLYGTPDSPPNDSEALDVLKIMIENDYVEPLLKNLPLYEFEAKKDAANIFNNLLRKGDEEEHPFVEHVVSKPKILERLLQGYENHDIALNCGLMLRECCRHEKLVELILGSDYFWKFFAHAQDPSFEMASDAFATFREILTKHHAVVAKFLEENYDRFFKEYDTFICEGNYVTRCQSLKLLGEILLERANYHVMSKFVQNKQNLISMMNLLRNESKNIQFEAFHCFKVFIANPNKSDEILDILLRNKGKLVSFLENFRLEIDTPQFKAEKEYLIQQVVNLGEAPETTKTKRKKHDKEGNDAPRVKKKKKVSKQSSG